MPFVRKIKNFHQVTVKSAQLIILVSNTNEMKMFEMENKIFEIITEVDMNIEI